MFTLDNTECSTKITVISSNQYEIWLKKQPQYLKNWCLSSKCSSLAAEVTLAVEDLPKSLVASLEARNITCLYVKI